MSKKQTQKQIAAEHGVSLATVSRWVKAGVDIQDDDAIRVFRASQKTAPTASAEDLTAVRYRKLAGEAERIELSLDLLRGELLPKAEVEAGMSAIAHVCNAYDRAILSQLPGILVGLDSAAIEKCLRNWICEWVAKVQDAQSNVWKRAREATLKDLRGDARKAAIRYFANEEKQAGED